MRVIGSDKTVIIPARMVGGAWEYFYGGSLPKLRDGTIFDLVVPEFAIEDKSFLKRVQAHRYEELLPQDAAVYAAVSRHGIPLKLRDRALDAEMITTYPQEAIKRFPEKLFVRVLLEEPLKLLLRGTKLGQLNSVECVHSLAKSESTQSQPRVPAHI